MNIKDYSEKSFVVYGDDTKKYKEEIKKLGGKFNSNLKDVGPGWIFINKNREKVDDFFKTLDKKSDEISLELKPYSEKSFLITGDETKKYKEELKKMGGKWNTTLKGWIYSSKNEESLKEWINDKKGVSVDEEEYYSAEE